MNLSLVLLLMSAGCTTEPTRFYLLDLRAPPVRTKYSGENRLGISPVTLPEYLERSEIVTRVTAHRLNVAIVDVWAETLETNATNVLADLLAERLSVNRIVRPADESVETDFNLRVDFERFERQPTGAVLLAATWTVEHNESGAPEMVETTGIREGVAGQGYHAIAAAMSRTFDCFSQEISAALDELEFPRSDT